MILGYILVIVLIFLDQISKILVENLMTINQQITIIPHLINFHFTYNTGAAWSIFSDQRVLLALLSLVASGFFLYLMKDFSLKKEKVYSIALALITAGTIGNLIDRALRPKGVVDFLEFGFIEFPVFNIADSFLTIGVILLAVYIIFISKDGNIPLFRKKDKSQDKNQEEAKVEDASE